MKKYTIQISAGKGPKECAWVVDKLMKVVIKEAEQNEVEILEAVASPSKEVMLFSSVLFIVRADEDVLDKFVNNWIGTIQWIGESMFRKNHKRKNWFVKITGTPTNYYSNFSYNKSELIFETMRASGNGGQNVNKLETAIRLTHKPSGLVVISKDERTQYRNKQIALKRLQAKLKQLEMEETNLETQNFWQNHNEIERGNAKRIFKGLKFKEVKQN